MDGTGLGTDELLVLVELFAPWFCCSDCICSAAEYSVDNFLEHTWARLLARVWDMTTWSTYCRDEEWKWKLKAWTKMKMIARILNVTDYYLYMYNLHNCKLWEQNGHDTLPSAEEELGILTASHQHSCFYPTNPTAIEGSPVYQVDFPVKKSVKNNVRSQWTSCFELTNTHTFFLCIYTM